MKVDRKVELVHYSLGDLKSNYLGWWSLDEPLYNKSYKIKFQRILINTDKRETKEAYLLG